MPAKFENLKDVNGQWRFRLIVPNNEITAIREAYTRKATCLNGIESVKKNASIAEIVDLTR